MRRVLVRGIGVISAIGNNLAEHRQSLISANSGIGKTRFFSSRFAEDYPFGEVKLSNENLIEALKLKDTIGFTRTEYLAFTAFNEAVADAELSAEEISSPRTAVISCSTVGGMCLTDDVHRDSNRLVEQSQFSEAYSNSRHLLRLAKEYYLQGYLDCYNTACSSSANAIMMGARLIRSGKADRAIVGGVDSLAKYTANGFNALGILSKNPCRPFDQQRDGLNLGEGAAYLVLESAEEIPVTGLELSGWGNAADANHPSAISEEGEGPRTAIEAALKQAGLSGDQISYVNAHGTATENNDRTELEGIRRALGTVPMINSTKSYTGHTLAASGAIEAAISLLSLRHQEVYSNLNIDQPIENLGKSLITGHQKTKLNHVLSNSFGFAGNCSSLIFSKADVH